MTPQLQNQLRLKLEEFVLAVGLLTRFPLPAFQTSGAATLASSLWAYPVAGALVVASRAEVGDWTGAEQRQSWQESAATLGRVQQHPPCACLACFATGSRGLNMLLPTVPRRSMGVHISDRTSADRRT